MESFHPGQRWTSETEPELGLGIVTETSKGRVKIHFPQAGETRLYATESAPLRRILFKPGDQIQDEQGRSITVEKVIEAGPLVSYFGQGRELHESKLGDVAFQYGVEERLFAGDVDRPETFGLRRRALEFDHHRRISPTRGFLGGRIDLIPHQLYIAQEVSGRHAPRVLLSDEVGLGKTIEACLIIHRLLLSGRISRVLILVPESLVHQWFVETLRRFNMWFHIFDEERAEAIEETAPEGNPFLDNQLILCSAELLTKSPKRAAQAVNSRWDMLVVDEAHHLEWSVEAASMEYQVVEMLGQKTPGLLLLTATPEQLGLESHFARLRLLDPDRYSDFEAFRRESAKQKEMADIVGKLADGEALAPTEKAFLEAKFGKIHIQEGGDGGGKPNAELIRDILDQHGPGRVIFRNRRTAMSGFPKRIAHLAPIEVQEGDWIQKVSGEFPTASSPAKFQFRDLENDPRVAWLTALMKELGEAKALLICRSKELVLALEKVLRKHSHLKTGVFHEDLSLVQRDRNAAWFAEEDGARLLICSEIGSEGRNFQFAHHLVLFDLPLHPELLEQRIGRLDRIGQQEDIHIHVPYLRGSAQEVLVRWYQEGLSAFEESLEGGDKLFQRFGKQLEAAAQALLGENGASKMEALLLESRSFLVQHKSDLEKGRDRLLEMNSFKPELAAELIRQIEEQDARPDLEVFMLDVFEEFHIEVEDLDPRTYLLHPPQGNAAAFPGIPDEGMVATFDRRRALGREEIGFITWDHPMVTGAIDLVLGSGTGNASYGILAGKGSRGMVLEAYFVLEIPGTEHRGADRFLPNIPLRVVVDHAGKDQSDEFPVELLEVELRQGFMEDLLDNEVLMDTILPNMREKATERAENLGEREVAMGLARMRKTLDHEIQRLTDLQRKNKHIRPAEIQIAKEEKKELESLILDAKVRLDALQLIKKG